MLSVTKIIIIFNVIRCMCGFSHVIQTSTVPSWISSSWKIAKYITGTKSQLSLAMLNHNYYDHFFYTDQKNIFVLHKPVHSAHRLFCDSDFTKVHFSALRFSYSIFTLDSRSRCIRCFAKMDCVKLSIRAMFSFFISSHLYGIFEIN